MKNRRSRRACATVVTVGALAAVVMTAPVASGDLKAWHADSYPLVAVPLPNDVKFKPIDPVFTPEKMQKITEALCTQDELPQEDLDNIDTAYYTLPVDFGTAEEPKDPIAEVRKELLGTEKFTNESRLKLCEDEKLRTKYAKTLNDRIAKYGVVLKPELRKLQGQELKEEVHNVWVERLGNYSARLKKYLGDTEI
ncbi:hypothetical protein [Nocardia iowensis]|uniref:Uncharacterized protein n=1 Tax=Nocardia iowensis TaxID=204891 RepID=A0ABX8S0P9_NOCIO|nr:hypothetical protein [Nocardia iowensis]QXN94971.1 hypothetical protein KV110_19155 [Nocardia iowensis]